MQKQTSPTACSRAVLYSPLSFRVSATFATLILPFATISCKKEGSYSQQSPPSQTEIKKDVTEQITESLSPKPFSVELVQAHYSDDLIDEVLDKAPSCTTNFVGLSKSQLEESLIETDQAIERIEDSIDRIETRYPIDLNGNGYMPRAQRQSHEKLTTELLTYYDASNKAHESIYKIKLNLHPEEKSIEELKTLAQKLATDHKWTLESKGQSFGTIRVCKGEMNKYARQRAAYRLRFHDNEARYLEKRISQLCEEINTRETLSNKKL